MINTLSLILILIGTFMGAVGAVVIKKGTNKHSFFSLFKSSSLWIGLFLYGFSSIFYVIALRNGVFTTLYPLVSTTYIWTTLFSVKYLR